MLTQKDKHFSNINETKWRMTIVNRRYEYYALICFETKNNTLKYSQRSQGRTMYDRNF